MDEGAPVPHPRHAPPTQGIDVIAVSAQGRVVFMKEKQICLCHVGFRAMSQRCSFLCWKNLTGESLSLSHSLLGAVPLTLYRNFVLHVENAFRNRGLRVEVLVLGPRIPLGAAVHRQFIEGVLAVVRLSRPNQVSRKVPLQLFDRTAGLDNVRFLGKSTANLNGRWRFTYPFPQITPSLTPTCLLSYSATRLRQCSEGLPQLPLRQMSLLVFLRCRCSPCRFPRLTCPPSPTLPILQISLALWMALVSHLFYQHFNDLPIHNLCLPHNHPSPRLIHPQQTWLVFFPTHIGLHPSPTLIHNLSPVRRLIFSLPIYLSRIRPSYHFCQKALAANNSRVRHLQLLRYRT